MLMIPPGIGKDKALEMALHHPDEQKRQEAVAEIDDPDKLLFLVLHAPW